MFIIQLVEQLQNLDLYQCILYQCFLHSNSLVYQCFSFNLRNISSMCFTTFKSVGPSRRLLGHAEDSLEFIGDHSGRRGDLLRWTAHGKAEPMAIWGVTDDFPWRDAYTIAIYEISHGYVKLFMRYLNGYISITTFLFFWYTSMYHDIYIYIQWILWI